MKILIIDNAAIGKLKDNCYSTNKTNGPVIDDLIKCGHKICWYQFLLQNSEGAICYSLNKPEIECVTVKRRKNKIISYLIAYLKIIPLILKCDFVYIYYPNSFKYAASLCRIFGKKYGLYIRGMQGVDNKYSHSIYKKAFTIFTVSEYFTKSVNELVGRPIANSIRPMIPYTEDDIITNRKYTKKERYNILYLGRLDKDKGLTELLYAMKELKHNKNHSIFLKIVGYGAFQSEVQRLCQELCIEDIVSFEGSVNDDELKKQYYMEADAYILPTYHEGFPRTLYEAMIFGTPIITTFVGGIPSLMNDRVNCLRIEPKSTESIVNKIEKLMVNYEETATFITSNGQKTVAPIISKARLTHGQYIAKVLKVCN